MNKIYKFFVLATTLIFPVLFFNCSEEQLPVNAQLSFVHRGLQLATTGVTFGYNTNLTQTVEVIGENTPWTLTGLPDWLSASTTSGTGAATITLTAQENTSLDAARSAVLTFASTASDYQYSKTITVSQPVAEVSIKVSEDALGFMAKGETKTVSVTSSVEWTATCGDSWVSLSKADPTQLRVTVAENLGQTRSSTIHLKRSGSETTVATITVKQAEAGVQGSTEPLSFAVDGETRSTAISSEASWTADVSDEAWLSVTPSGGGAGSATIFVTAKANASANARSGFVYVRIGSAKKLAIPVSQDGVKFAVNPATVTLKSTASSATVSVTANASWIVVSKPEWLTMQLPETLTGTHDITITAQENPSTSSRTGKVVIGRSNFAGNQSITVTQEALDVPSLTSRMDFPATAATQTIAIATGGAWTASTSDSWIHLSPASGQGEGTLKVSVDANPGSDERTGHFVVTIGSVPQTVTVVQVGCYIRLSCEDVLTKSTPVSVQLTVQSNLTWTASSDVAWLKVSPQQGDGDATLTVTVADNPSVHERTGVITVASGSVTKAFTFKQPGRTLSLSTTALTFAKDGGTSESVIVTTDGTFEVKTSESWLTINRSGNTFSVKAATNTGAARNAEITVSLTGLNNGETLSRIISVSQAAADVGTKVTITANGVSFNMIKVEGGTFQMGEEGVATPVHQVTLTNDYYIGETEVTQAVWQAVMGSEPTASGGWKEEYGRGDSYPAYNVSWNDCQTFIQKLNDLTGKTFRLLTEAEWEFAARGGNASQGYTYSGSNTLDDVAWYWDNIPSQTSGQAGYGTQPVATKVPNELGIYDMSGNVSEWCQDWYGDYSSDVQMNPTGPASGSDHVRRGGAWNYAGDGCRMARRDRDNTGTWGRIIGLRLALPTVQPEHRLSLSTTSLSFTSAGGTSETVTVDTDDAFEVKTSASWLTITQNGKTFTITAAANTGAARSAEITVSLTGLSSAETLSRTIAVSQAAADVSTKVTYTANGVSFNMIKVEGGTFQMGSTTGNSDEKPVHQVTLSDYYIGETEVTQALWQAVMGSNPSNFNGTNRPVEQVSWNDCQTFIRKLNELTGKTFRLPTEAEWEFAARGGTKSQGYTYSGSNIVGDVAWHSQNSSNKTHEVATKAPNELGIYDMSGNVWEWCQDWYDTYSSNAQTNPTGPTSGPGRVVRGGSLKDPGDYCRVVGRGGDNPSGTGDDLGLRLALPTVETEHRLSLSTTSLSFTSAGGTSEAVTVDTDDAFEVKTSASWLTINRSGKTFTITAAANTGAARSAEITVSLTGLSSGQSLSQTIAVSQAAADNSPKVTFTANGVTFNMIKVDGGTFQMGQEGIETPVHQVTLSDYYIGETEVTQALWQAVMGSNPSHFKGTNLPVECVSWTDCQNFISKLNELTGKTFRLPTEAEWEFAARGGTKSQGYTYSGSNTIGDVAWYTNNSSSKTHEVATKAPNELGIYDMSGNVWEWCQDWYGSYSSDAQTNPTGPTSGSIRVARGGDWGSIGNYCRVAYRNWYIPSSTYYYLGLRLAF